MAEDLERQKLEIGTAAGLSVSLCSRLRGETTADLMNDVPRLREQAERVEALDSERWAAIRAAEKPSRPEPVSSLGQHAGGDDEWAAFRRLFEELPAPRATEPFVHLSRDRRVR